LVERYLRGEFAARAADLDPYLAALPYACDRWQAGPALRDWLKAGRLVVCNRYVPANMAHQGSKIEATAGREAFYNWISELEYGIFGLPVPDLAVLLEMPGGCALELIARRERGGSGREGGDIHEADASHLAATALAYREVAARSDCPWAVVSCASQGAVRPVSDIAQDVWAEVSRVL
jgi:dTMP kinase